MHLFMSQCRCISFQRLNFLKLLCFENFVIIGLKVDADYINCTNSGYFVNWNPVVGVADIGTIHIVHHFDYKDLLVSDMLMAAQNYTAGIAHQEL